MTAELLVNSADACIPIPRTASHSEPITTKCRTSSTYYIPFMHILGSSKFSMPECKCTGNALPPQSVATPHLAEELLIILASSFIADANTRPTVSTEHHHNNVTRDHAPLYSELTALSMSAIVRIIINNTAPIFSSTFYIL